MESLNNTASPYGASKAILDWFVRLASFGEPWSTSFVFYPGLVVTDLISVIPDTQELGAISVETSVDGMLRAFDETAPNDLTCTVCNYNSSILPW